MLCLALARCSVPTTLHSHTIRSAAAFHHVKYSQRYRVYITPCHDMTQGYMSWHVDISYYIVAAAISASHTDITCQRPLFLAVQAFSTRRTLLAMTDKSTRAGPTGHYHPSERCVCVCVWGGGHVSRSLDCKQSIRLSLTLCCSGSPCSRDWEAPRGAERCALPVRPRPHFSTLSRWRRKN